MPVKIILDTDIESDSRQAIGGVNVTGRSLGERKLREIRFEMP